MFTERPQLRLHVVGSSGTYPAPGRPGSGYVVQQGDTRVWCDAGPGTFTALPFDPDLIDAIVISHQHPDHCSDLATAFHAWTYRPDPRHGVPVYGPQAVWDRLSAFLEKEPESALNETFDFVPVSGGDSKDVGDLRISFLDMNHSVPTVGTMWEGHNRTLFYTGDTGTGSWKEGVRDVDVMLSEASFQGPSSEKTVEHHMTAGEAGAIAREIGVGRLVLTHIPPYLEAARSVHEAELEFDRPVGLATPGAALDI